MDKSEMNKLLRRKLQANYEAYMRLLNSQSPPSLIEQAAEIAAAKKVYKMLNENRVPYDPALFEYLLRFDNPLEVVRDQFMKNHGCEPEIDMEMTLVCLAEKRTAEQGGYELDAEHQPMQIGEMKLC